MALSLCMITKNEEKYIETCLESAINFVDEIIIVDTGSSDNTKEICRNFCLRKKFLGLKIFDFEWVDDFSKARNESLKHATKKWILVLDADEVLEEKDFKKIMELTKESGEFCGFGLEQRSYLRDYFEGAFENKSDFEPAKKYPYYVSNRIIRIFMNRLGVNFRHRIHELVEDSFEELNLKHKKSEVVIHHFGSVKEHSALSAKTEFYSKIILRQAEDHPESARYSYQAARMFLGQRDYIKALEYFEKTAKINPKYKLVFSEIAKVHLRLKDKILAIENFRKSFEQNQNNPSPINNLAILYMSIGKFEMAKNILEEQLKRFPSEMALIKNYRDCLKNIPL